MKIAYSKSDTEYQLQQLDKLANEEQNPSRQWDFMHYRMKLSAGNLQANDCKVGDWITLDSESLRGLSWDYVFQILNIDGCIATISYGDSTIYGAITIFDIVPHEDFNLKPKFKMGDEIKSLEGKINSYWYNLKENEWYYRVRSRQYPESELEDPTQNLIKKCAYLRQQLEFANIAKKDMYE